MNSVPLNYLYILYTLWTIKRWQNIFQSYGHKCSATFFMVHSVLYYNIFVPYLCIYVWADNTDHFFSRWDALCQSDVAVYCFQLAVRLAHWLYCWIFKTDILMGKMCLQCREGKWNNLHSWPWWMLPSIVGQCCTGHDGIYCHLV